MGSVMKETPESAIWSVTLEKVDYIYIYKNKGIGNISFQMRGHFQRELNE